MLGTRDYVQKCGFEKVILGLSGGIDSALVACIAAEALGPENVHAVMIPSKFTSKESLDDAKQLADNLGLDYRIVPLTDLHEAMLTTLDGDNSLSDLARENLQSRLRGNILMTLSNSLNALMLCTGNKSEIAVGYNTLYGDTCGALAVIGDVLKTTVYSLAEYLNSDREIIPVNIIERSPSAELKEDQVDQDTLPPYKFLDKLVLLYVQEMKSLKEILESGDEDLTDKQEITRVLNLIDRNEYKRQQSPPVLKIAGKAFGVGRRMPIAQRFGHN